MMGTDTIAAVASPFGEGAVALLRLSGPDALAIADRVCRFASGSLPSAAKSKRVYRATLREAGGEALDEVLCCVHRAPRTYTGEDLVEITCHGGILLTRRALSALLVAGARLANPGEFTQRAFLNGKMDLTQAEAVMDLITAQTDLAIKAASEQLAGRLGERANQLRENLLDIVAHVEAYIDFPDEDIDPDTGAALLARLEALVEELDHLLATARQGRILREGVRTVIYGAPNVGKSSLLNALLGSDRAIVSPLPGTTRDTIEEFASLRGLPLRLIDTAGLRETADPVEAAGILRTRASVASADLVLEVLDASRPRDESSPDLPRQSVANAVTIRVLNKVDLGAHPCWNVEGAPGGSVFVSCVTGEGVDRLGDLIHEQITGGEVAWSPSMVAINTRHQHCLERVRQSLLAVATGLRARISPEFLAVDLRQGLAALGEMVGGVDTEVILTRIFSTFCIGK